jgi:hypothetical protein
MKNAYPLSLKPLISNLWSHQIQQCQTGVQLHQDGQGHKHVPLDGLEG